MAKVSFTTKGYIEVWYGQTFVSRHRSETEAIESLTEYAATLSPGEHAFELRYPNKTVKVYGVLPSSPAPATPTDLAAEDVTAGYVSLSWADDGNGTSWVVYRDGVPIATVSGTAHTDSAVVPSTAYSYQVQASNSTGASALSAALAVTTSANSLPLWSLSDQSGTIGVAYSLNLNAVCEDDDGHARTYSLVSGSVAGLSLVSPNYSGTPTAAGAFPLTFRANDGYGTSDVSITFTVADPDVTAPTVPTNVAASANGSTVTVTWTASTDASGVANYRVYRNGVFRATSTGSPYVESGVPVGSYSYTVSAVDSSANANESAQSSAAPVTVVPETPDVPINLTATAASPTQINLSWAAGPNGETPTSYELQYSLNGTSGWTAVYSGALTTASHTSLTAGTTYYYRVRALAGASVSPYTAVASAATLSSGTLLTEDFSSSTWYTQWHHSERVNNKTPPFNCTSQTQTGTIARIAPSYNSQSYVPRTPTSYALKVTIPSGTNEGTTLSFYPYFPPGNPNTGGSANKLSDFPTEMYLEYHLRLGDTWVPAQNGKLPGFRSARRTDAMHKNFPGADGQGGSGCDGLHGWSARAGYQDPCVPATGRWRYKGYVYHADQAGLYGENIEGGIDTYGSCSTGFALNTWYKLKYYCKPNTAAGSANGILRMWVDDVLVGEHTTYRFDLTSGRDHPLARVWMDIYHGGTTVAPQDLHCFLSDVRIWVP